MLRHSLNVCLLIVALAFIAPLPIHGQELSTQEHDPASGVVLPDTAETTPSSRSSAVPGDSAKPQARVVRADGAAPGGTVQFKPGLEDLDAGAASADGAASIEADGSSLGQQRTADIGSSGQTYAVSSSVALTQAASPKSWIEKLPVIGAVIFTAIFLLTFRFIFRFIVRISSYVLKFLAKIIRPVSNVLRRFKIVTSQKKDLQVLQLAWRLVLSQTQ